MARKSGQKRNRTLKPADPQRDERNTRRFVDRRTEGLGIPAQDLPDANPGQNDARTGDDFQRNLPQQHGGEMTSPENYNEGGLRGDRDLSDADRHGGRKGN